MSRRVPPTEIKRKLLHISSGFLVLIFWLTGREAAIFILAAATLGSFSVEGLRLNTAWGATLYRRWFGAMTRSSESHSLTGATHMLVGALLTVALFPLAIAIPALLFLSWGDAAAALVGQKYGTVRIMGSKTVQGSLACLAVCLIITVPFSLSIGVKISGAAAATLAELIPWGVINDNLAIPMISGAVMLSFLATGL